MKDWRQVGGGGYNSRMDHRRGGDSGINSKEGGGGGHGININGN